jgi:hypothetical protein
MPILRPAPGVGKNPLGARSVADARKVPSASSATPATRPAESGRWSSPSTPARSMITDIVSCPAIVAPVTPPAPSVRTEINTVVT